MICSQLLRRLAFAGLILTAAPLFAADVTSTWNAASGNWGINGNWTNVPALGGFPNNGNVGVPTYDAVLSNGGTITLDQNITIDKFTLSSGTVTGSFNLTLNDNLTWTGGTMSGTGATSVAGAASTISGSSVKGLDRTLSNSGTLTYSTSDGSNPISFGRNSALTPGVLNNSGTFNVTAGGDFSEFNGNASHAINNAGTWNVSGATFTSNVNGIAFNNSGTVNVASGVFSLNGGDDGSTTGDFDVSSGATLRFGGGTFNLSAAADLSGAGIVEFSGGTANLLSNAVANILVSGGTANFNGATTAGSIALSSGTLGGTGSVSASGNLTWTGGTMSGTGATSVAGAASTISGSSVKGLDRTLSNSGTLTYSTSDGSNPISFGRNSALTPGVLNNSGTFNVTAGGDFSEFNGNASHAINNAGTWNVSGATFTSNVNGIAFNNSGTVNVASGVFSLNGGDDGSTTGDFDVSSGATLRFGGGTFNLSAAADLSGAGIVEFSGGTANLLSNAVANILVSGGTANFNGATTAGSIALSSGTLGGTGSVSASGNLTWTGGTMSGTGATSVAGAASTISGSSVKGLDRTLSNSGTLTYSTSDGSNPISFGRNSALTPGVLNNSGTFNVTAGGDFSEFNGNASHAINNAGTWNVSGATFTSNVNGIAFNNSGTVNVASGVFSLNGGDDGSTTGDFDVSSGATLRFGGGTFNLSAAADLSGAGIVEFSGGTANLLSNAVANILVSGGTANFNGATTAGSIALSSGTLGGTGSVSASGNLTWTGGTMSGTGATSVAGAASTISGSSVKGLDRTLSNSGTLTYSTSDGSNPISFGRNSALTPGVLNNSGTFNVTAGGDFSEFNGNASHAINNAGTWNVSGAAFTSNVNGIAFNNSGSVNVTSGIFNPAGGYTQTAGVTRSNGATINGSATNLSGGTFEGTGTINATTLVATGGVWNVRGTVSGLSTVNSGTFTIGNEGNLRANGGLNVTGSGMIVAAGPSATITGNVSYLASASSTFAGMIVGAGKTLTINNAAATLTLAGANTYTGATTVTAGILKAGAASVSGSGAFGRNSAVSIANSASALLDITGFDTQIGSLSGGGVSGGNVILGAATLTFGGSNASPAVYDGVISGSGGIAKIGAGTQTLSRSQTYTGRTTVGGGVLRIDFTGLATPTNLLNSSSALTLGGGTLSVLGKTGVGIVTAQTLGAVTLSANTFSTIALDPNNSGAGGTTLTLGNAWTRNPGSTLLIDTSSASTGARSVRTTAAVSGSGAAGTNGIFGYALVRDSGGTGFARQDGSFNFVRNTTAGTVLTTSNSVAATTAVDFTTVSTDPGYSGVGGTLTLANVAHAASTLSINTTGGGTLNLGGVTGVLALTNNAVLVQGTGNYTIQNGALGASGSEVIVHQIGSGLLTISSPISGGAGGLMKDGSGTLTLTGLQDYATLTTGGGITNLPVALGTGSSTLNANARTNISTSQTLAALNIGDGGVVTLSTILPPALAGDAELDGAVNFDDASLPAGAFGEQNGIFASQDAMLTNDAVQAVPEPGSLGLLLLGAMAMLRRRQR